MLVSFVSKFICGSYYWKDSSRSQPGLPDAWLSSSGVDCHDVKTMLSEGHVERLSHRASSPDGLKGDGNHRES